MRRVKVIIIPSHIWKLYLLIVYVYWSVFIPSKYVDHSVKMFCVWSLTAFDCVGEWEGWMFWVLLVILSTWCLCYALIIRCFIFMWIFVLSCAGGVKEVNVFVDLAFISAGEEPWAIGRVNCFHAAVTGYAPLIFLDKSKGCRHLLQECRRVFANVAADGSLPEKLASVLFVLYVSDYRNGQ